MIIGFTYSVSLKKLQHITAFEYSPIATTCENKYFRGNTVCAFLLLEIIGRQRWKQRSECRLRPNCFVKSARFTDPLSELPKVNFFQSFINPKSPFFHCNSPQFYANWNVVTKACPVAWDYSQIISFSASDFAKAFKPFSSGFTVLEKQILAGHEPSTLRLISPMKIGNLTLEA